MQDDDTIIPAPPAGQAAGRKPKSASPRGRKVRCSFCDKPLAAARAMVKSASAHICDECIVRFRALVQGGEPSA